MIKLITRNAIYKPFIDEKDYEIKSSDLILKGEHYYILINVLSDKCMHHLELKLKSNIDSIKYNIYSVENVIVKDVDYDWNKRDDFNLFDKGLIMPDPLLLKDKCGFRIQANSNNHFLVELEPILKDGKVDIDFELVDMSTQELLASNHFDLTVSKIEAVDSDLVMTHWFHYDCIQEMYHSKFMSDDYLNILTPFVKEYVKMGNNMILTPLFTVCLDTEIGSERPTCQLIKVLKEKDKYTFNFDDFERFISFMQNLGVKYFEMSHLFTQWGAKKCPKVEVVEDEITINIFGWNTDSDSLEYRTFLKEFIPELKKEIYKLKIEDYVYFHISDEPNENTKVLYESHSKFLKEMLKEFKFIDALSNPLYDSLVDIPVIPVDEFYKFENSKKDKWAYYCCGQTAKNVTNAFISNPGIRTRILGILLYKENAKGFLQWGYNYWFSYLSRSLINPFLTNDSNGAFPPGDAFLVYPGNRDVVTSLRVKFLTKAIDDYRILKTLESRIGRDGVIKILNDFGYHSFLDYNLEEHNFENMMFEIRTMLSNE